MVSVVGMGPGSESYLLPAAKNVVSNADIVVSDQRWSQFVPENAFFSFDYKRTKEIVGLIRDAEKSGKSIALLVSGDPGLYSLLHVIKREAPEIDIQVVPGVSAAQVLFARLGLDWTDVVFMSVHGRSARELQKKLRPGQRCCIFADRMNDPAKIGECLRRSGFSGRAVVGENLTLENESITKTSIESLSEYRAVGLATVYLEID